MDALRDHRRSDLRHDRDDHRVRYIVNRRDHHVNRKSGLPDDDHRLLSDDRHRMGYLDVDDLKLGVSLVVSRGHRMNDRLDDHLMDDDRHDVLVGHRTNVMDDRNDQNLDGNRVNRNCVLRDQNLGAMTGVNHDRHTSDPLVYRKTDVSSDENRDLRMNGMDDLNDRNLGVNLCHRMNDPLDDHLMDDGHRDVLVGRRTNVTDDRNDLKMGGTTDVSHGHRMNDLLDDLNVDVNRDHRMNVTDDRHDLKMDETTDVNLCHRMNVMDDRNDLTMVVSLDVNRGRRMSDRLDDRKMDGNHVNRNFAPHDPKMVANLDGMNLHVRLMDDLNMSCDRMSHDHLRCDHLKMRHRDTNPMDGKSLGAMILDVKMTIRHVIHRMMVCPKTDDRKMI